jgi:subtilisin family serine protease
MSRITINDVSIDPLAQGQLMAAAGIEAPDASRSNYILVQTAAPLTEEQKAQLAGLGVEIQEYVPDDTYLARYVPTDLGPIRALPFVTWAGVYLKGFKIPPTLKPAAPDPATAIVPDLNVNPPSRKPRTVDVVLHEGVDPNQVKASIAAAAKVDPDSVQAGNRKIRLRVEQGQLDKLALLDEVRHIEPVPERQLFNNVSRAILNADTVTLNGTTYEGDGEIVAVADTGFDRGSTSNTHPAFTGRVKKLYSLGRPNKSDDPHGHGTHCRRLGAGRRQLDQHGRQDQGYGSQGLARPPVHTRQWWGAGRPAVGPARPVPAGVRQ